MIRRSRTRKYLTSEVRANHRRTGASKWTKSKFKSSPSHTRIRLTWDSNLRRRRVSSMRRMCSVRGLVRGALMKKPPCTKTWSTSRALTCWPTWVPGLRSVRRSTRRIPYMSSTLPSSNSSTRSIGTVCHGPSLCASFWCATGVPTIWWVSRMSMRLCSSAWSSSWLTISILPTQWMLIESSTSRCSIVSSQRSRKAWSMIFKIGHPMPSSRTTRNSQSNRRRNALSTS